MKPGQPRWRRDLAIALAGLLALVLWEAAGWDRPLAHLFGGPGGFAWREAWLTRVLLHDGGRVAAGVLLALLALDALRPLVAGPTRRERLAGLGLTLAGLLLVPALKRFSTTSCPWDLAEFGGRFAYVPHWLAGVTDGGPGHCFPSGHAVAAFAFFGVYFAWRRSRPGLARAWAIAIVAAGLLFGWAQMARGAHFASHTLWSAWLCWVLGAAASLRRATPALSRNAAPACG